MKQRVERRSGGMATVEEIKIHKNKETQRFRCDLVHCRPGYMVLSYTSSKPGKISDISIPPGSTTIAHYWQDRHYVLWRMFDVSGNLIGSLFHICRNVNISESRVGYEDLLLDIWVAPDGIVRILDEDEVEQCRQARLLTAAEEEIIAMQKSHITRDFAKIIAKVADFDPDHGPDRASDRPAR